MKEIKGGAAIIPNSLGWIRLRFFVCGELRLVLLSLVDVEGACMRHIPLRMLNVGGRIVVRTCFRFNI